MRMGVDYHTRKERGEQFSEAIIMSHLSERDGWFMRDKEDIPIYW